MNIIFLGTPEFAVNVLNKIVESDHKVVAVVCQPDKPASRGKKLEMPPIKKRAMELGIKVYQFAKIRRDGVGDLKSLNADIMVTAAYGQILSQEIIDICPNGIINVHGSLLPKYRGAAPIQQAIIDGETETGITIMKTEAGIDTGDVLLVRSIPILKDDTFGTLSEKLSVLGGELCVQALDLIENKKAKFTKQNDENATYTKMIKKEDSIIDFNRDANQIVNLIRGLNPNPVALLTICGQSYKVYSARVVLYDGNEQNGTVLKADGKSGLVIKCNGGAVELLEITAPNSKKMLAKSYLNGKKIELGSICNG